MQNQVLDLTKVIQSQAEALIALSQIQNVIPTASYFEIGTAILASREASR
jgi:hypothetical protein